MKISAKGQYRATKKDIKTVTHKVRFRPQNFKGTSGICDILYAVHTVASATKMHLTSLKRIIAKFVHGVSTKDIISVDFLNELRLVGRRRSDRT